MSRRNLQSNIVEIKRTRDTVETAHRAYIKNLTKNADSVRGVAKRTGAGGFGDIASLIESMEIPVKKIAAGYDNFFQASEEQHNIVADRANSAFDL